MKLRPYQKKTRDEIYDQWEMGADNVLAVLPTGAGKTVLLSDIIKNEREATCTIAHRQELVSQISLALARNEIRHKIIGPTEIVRFVVKLHLEEFGRSYYSPNSRHAIAGIDTLIRRKATLSDWLKRVKLWVLDEAHHLLKENKWGLGVDMFPNARGLGVTATPIRADRKGLGKKREFFSELEERRFYSSKQCLAGMDIEEFYPNDGRFDCLVVGPSMRELMAMGFLTDYKIYVPKIEDLDLSKVKVSKKTGDYNKDDLKKKIRQTRVVGDVVKHYKKIASGKLGITFATDVQTATEIAAEFNANGIPAAAVSAKTPGPERTGLIRRFRNREILQLVNVDLFGEGFDLPAIEVVSMARPTQSYALFSQQFGRSLRPMKGKNHAIIIDHVGNVLRQGLPDRDRNWSLEPGSRRGRRGDNDDGIPVTNCSKCSFCYERTKKVCPECGHKEVIYGREIDFVDGDLTELTPEKLAELRGQVSTANHSVEAERSRLVAKHAPLVGQLAGVKRHGVLLEQREQLKTEIAQWAGYEKASGNSDSQSYRRFYFKFGVDVLTAQTLKSKETLELTKKIRDDYDSRRVGKIIRYPNLRYHGFKA